MIDPEQVARDAQDSQVRLDTLIRIRWLAIIGQLAAVLFVAFYLKFEFQFYLCMAAIACSVWLNLFLGQRYKANFRLSANAALSLLIFDTLQLAILLYLTGGIQNPFAMLIVVPVVISSTINSFRQTLILACLVVVLTILLTILHLPLPWYEDDAVRLPAIYVAGVWLAIFSAMTFTAFYVYRVASESRNLSQALSATELILQREQYLNSLDGLAAAAAHELGTPLATIALVSKEMTRELPEDSPMQEDAKLLRSEAGRCRDILQKLTSLSNEGEQHIGKLSLASLMDEIAEPHRDFGIELKINIDGPEATDYSPPQFVRNPAIMYGVGNLMENAVDFAETRVDFDCFWDDKQVELMITDNGPGYPRDLLERIGEPYVSTRNRDQQKTGGGLGLGLFIAKTLLERSGATLQFTSGADPQMAGAQVSVIWPRVLLDEQMEAYNQRLEAGGWQ